MAIITYSTNILPKNNNAGHISTIITEHDMQDIVARSGKSKNSRQEHSQDTYTCKIEVHACIYTNISYNALKKMGNFNEICSKCITQTRKLRL